MSSSIPLRRHAVERVPIPPRLEIHLTEQENKIFDLLNECTEYLKETKQISTTCRIAGGWVRDKLLGHDSNDIDIALSNMMGETFADHLASYADMKGVEYGKITKIEKNPQQSKHLETATFKLGGLDFDLVNLRSEAYAEDSRIPTEVVFGTPLEDAKRRDITINALFYNVHTKEVEDHTGRGLDDMRNGLIRTPLPPIETFKDDPLRVLRCVRFASRLGFELDPELSTAAQDPVIQDALVTKVSRERVGIEVDKMMRARDPLRSIELFYQLSLYNPAFFSAIPHGISSKFSERVFYPREGLASTVILDTLLNRSHSQLPSPHPLLLKHIHTDKSAKPRLFLSAALSPYKAVTYSDKKAKLHHAADAVVRESLKLGAQNHYVDGIPSLFLSLGPVSKLVEEYLAFDVDTARSSIGLALRSKDIHNPNSGIHWSESAFFSLVVELGDLYDVASDDLDVDQAAKILTKYNQFAERIQELDLYNVGQAVPLLNGTQIMQAMGATKGGPWLSEVHAHMMRWQLDHPVASPGDCRTWLEAEKTADKLPSVTSQPPSKRPRIK